MAYSHLVDVSCRPVQAIDDYILTPICDMTILSKGDFFSSNRSVDHVVNTGRPIPHYVSRKNNCCMWRDRFICR